MHTCESYIIGNMQYLVVESNICSSRISIIMVGKTDEFRKQFIGGVTNPHIYYKD